MTESQHQIPTTVKVGQVINVRLTAEAQWAASVSGGHVGRARRLATDEQARERRKRALGLARDAATPSRAYAAAEELVATAEAEAKALAGDRNEAESEELRRVFLMSKWQELEEFLGHVTPMEYDAYLDL